MRYSRVFSAGVLCVALMGCDDSDNGLFGPGDNQPPSNPLTFEWSGAIDAGDHLEIRGINGQIDVNPASGNEVEVFARKRWERSDPDEVTFEVVRHADGVTVCAVYPNPLPGARNECRPDGAGDTRVGDNDVRVDFEIRLPAGIDLQTANVNGSLRAEGLDSNVFAGTVNGDLRITTSGMISAATVNGDVVALLGAEEWDQDLRFATVNGNVDLTLPGAVNADVNATSVSGRITSDFPLTIDGGFVGATATGRLGQGGRDLEVAVVTGDVTIRRRLAS